ncbi:MAG: hypothetical protein ABFD92_16885 [Planctomycetaceae bacterium]
MTRVYYVVDARPVEKQHGLRFRGNIVAACLLPVDLGCKAFQSHALTVTELADDDPLVLKLQAVAATGEQPIVPWPYQTFKTVAGPDGPMEVTDELCPVGRRVDLGN